MSFEESSRTDTSGGGSGGGFDDALRASLSRSSGGGRLEAFLAQPRSSEALRDWLGLEPGDPAPTTEEWISKLTRDIAAIDTLVERQLNAILHSSPFQKLEASWRGLSWLVGEVPREAKVKVRVLSVSWIDLAKDAERAIEFDQSQLFRKIYSSEFGSPGGEPFGVLLGDYQVSHRPRADQPVDDVRVLRSVAQVAAAAFAPFITSIHPSLLGLDSFGELESPIDLARTFRGVEYTAWRSLRESPDSRFLGLTLPRTLARGPYLHDPDRKESFPFSESCHVHEDYL
ncbi:MAG: type VI secretion system contractile sheath large subunit, partial [Planctomycetota bacterium]